MTSPRSVLDKPLNQLTEDDISQLTREDCRKFLKDKGMRRPSWNKSQAIQQVISLKALLEGHGDDDSGAKTLRKIVASPAENPPRANSNSNSPDSAKELSAGASVSEFADEAVPYRRKDLLESAPHEDVASAAADLEKNAVSPRNVGAGEVTLGQMTIFYCGKVNVYDRVSPDKARTIMQLAASPIPLPLDDSSNGSAAIWSLPCHIQATSDNLCLFPQRAMVSHTTSHTTQTDMEGHMNRKVRLQKYFDKRKDRVKFKSRKDAGPASSGLEMMYLNQIRMPVPDGQLRKNAGTRAPQPGMAHGKNNPIGLPVATDLIEYLKVPNMEILSKGMALGADDGSFIEIIAIPRINGKMKELVLLKSMCSASADIFLPVLVRDL